MYAKCHAQIVSDYVASQNGNPIPGMIPAAMVRSQVSRDPPLESKAAPEVVKSSQVSHFLLRKTLLLALKLT